MQVCDVPPLGSDLPPLNGPAALERVGDRLPAAALAHGSAPTRSRRPLADRSAAWVDGLDALFYVEQAPASGADRGVDHRRRCRLLGVAAPVRLDHRSVCAVDAARTRRARSSSTSTATSRPARRGTTVPGRRSSRHRWTWTARRRLGVRRNSNASARSGQRSVRTTRRSTST